MVPRRTSARWVLVVCGGTHVANHLAEYWQVLAPDPRLHFRLLLPSGERRQACTTPTRAVLPLRQVGQRWAKVFPWDLAVVADHDEEGTPDPDRCPVVRLQHGVPGKRLDDGIYAFGPRSFDDEGRLRFTRILVSSEATRRLATRIDPAFADVVAVVGSLDDDRLLAEARHRDEHRRRLGIAPGDVVVLVTSTWGPSGLFQRLGDALLREAHALQGEFRFILSAHGLDYQPGPPGERVWGEYIASQTSQGFLVRDPGEDWVPYLVACDVVLTDHTSVATHAVLINRPVVHIRVPEGLLEPGSPIQRLHELTPEVREDASDLGDVLRAALLDGPHHELRDLATQLNSYPGEAASRIRRETHDLLRLEIPLTQAMPGEALP